MPDVPAPLTPSECDLRNFRYMSLDVVRLRDSNFAAMDPEAFRAGVVSWCIAWHQQPAASLPDDDAILCRLLGYGQDIKKWKKVRAAGALHGYVKCRDGRLYHPVVAEKAREAWMAKQAHHSRTEAARLARVAKSRSQFSSQAGTPSVTDDVTYDVTDTVTSNVTDNVTYDIIENVTDNVTLRSTENVTASKGREMNGKENNSTVPGSTPERPGSKVELWKGGLTTVMRLTRQSEEFMSQTVGAALCDLGSRSRGIVRSDFGGWRSINRTACRMA